MKHTFITILKKAKNKILRMRLDYNLRKRFLILLGFTRVFMIFIILFKIYNK